MCALVLLVLCLLLSFYFEFELKSEQKEKEKEVLLYALRRCCVRATYYIQPDHNPSQSQTTRKNYTKTTRTPDSRTPNPPTNPKQ